MQNNTDLFTPLPVDISTPNALLYQLNDSDEKFLKSTEFYAFEMDSFTVPEIDTMSGLSPIPEETSCSLHVPPIDALFSSVDPAHSQPKYSCTYLHVPSSALSKQVACDLCSETFSSAQVLRLHRRVQHILTKEFRCRKCPASFNFESNFHLHLASHVPSSCSSSKECPECKMSFKRISSFKGHLKSHQTNDLFKCNRCEKEFESKGYYEKHLATAHKPGVDGTVEEILASVTSNARNRLKGKKVQGKYQCQTCGKDFVKPCLLKRHEVCHTGAKPFQCTECDQAFTQKPSLARHMLLHKGVKDFKCPKCSLSFAQKNNLIVHIKRTHPMRPNLDSMFACDFCSCVFTKLNSVNRHKALMHPRGDTGAETDGFNDDDEDNVNVAKVMEQLKSFQESMNIMDMQPPALELSLLKPPSPGPKIRTVTVVDTLNPNKEKTFKMVKEISYKGQRTLACMHCDKAFKRQFDLLRHLRTHTQERAFQCEFCEKTFTTSAALKVHYRVHVSLSEKPAKVYACTVTDCGKRFPSMRKLDVHTRTHLSSVSYICSLCSKSFSSKAGFSAHKHHPKDKEFDMVRPFLEPPVKLNLNDTEEADKIEEYSKRSHQCSVCGVKMQKLSHLQQHEATHTGEKPFKCSICFRSYTTKSSLNLHHKIHTAEKPHACKICNSKFITQSVLQRHMISHSNERKFACPYCSERFKTNDNCKNHILMHARSLLASPEISPLREAYPEPSSPVQEDSSPETVAKPFIAVVQSPQKNASPKFIQLEMVKDCKKHTHKNLTIETVTNSPKKSSKKSLARSLKQISQIGHRCGECGKTFYKASDLQRHTRTHTKEKPYMCSICSKGFALLSTLGQHMKTHDTLRETFGCQVCGKKYSSRKVLLVHLRIHTGERPFQCGVCKNKFRTSGHKISHMKAHHKKRR